MEFLLQCHVDPGADELHVGPHKINPDLTDLVMYCILHLDIYEPHRSLTVMNEGILVAFWLPFLAVYLPNRYMAGKFSSNLASKKLLYTDPEQNVLSYPVSWL